jgi:hypothetical protein
MLCRCLPSGVGAALPHTAADLAGLLGCFSGHVIADVSTLLLGLCMACSVCVTLVPQKLPHTENKVLANIALSSCLAIAMTTHAVACVCTPKVELGEQLSQAGTLGSSSSLSAALTSLLGGKAALAAMVTQGSSNSSSGAAPLPQPTEAVLLAFIVAVALAELSRAALAPLPDLGAP